MPAAVTPAPTGKKIVHGCYACPTPTLLNTTHSRIHTHDKMVVRMSAIDATHPPSCHKETMLPGIGTPAGSSKAQGRGKEGWVRL
jgi:hypothetical protein